MLVDSPGLMVTADTPENQMAAWLFARYLLSPEVQAKLVQSGFSLPVRSSTMDLLGDFANRYPQWAQAVEMMDIARPVPISSDWGIGQWVLQDGFYRLLQGERDDLPTILEDVDVLVSELATREQ
jgi:ABC-type glycerol-3-phosphate transport system substrate-binding protein